MIAALNTIIIYAKNMQRSAEFYQKYFGFESTGEVVEGLIELTAAQGGLNILIHQAARSVRGGQVGLKLMFDVEDIEAFKQQSAELGLVFGTTHHANGYSFANTKDLDNNAISISSRRFRATV
jgi:predicted enzyme related to lactoylglutathione lyase